MDPFILRPHPSPGKCRVKGCRGGVSKNPRHKNGPFCRRCKDRRHKALHPYTYSLNKLRNNAKRRGISFDLTLEEWMMFCDVTGYVHAAGRGSSDLSVDRIDPNEGYTLSNIRAITGGENRRKQWADAKIERWRQRWHLLNRFTKAA